MQSSCPPSAFLPDQSWFALVPIYPVLQLPQLSELSTNLLSPVLEARLGGRGRGEGAPPVGLSAAEDYPGAAAHHPTSVHYLRGQQTNTNVKSIPQENILQMFPMTRNLKVRPMDLIQNGDGHMNIFSTDLLVGRSPQICTVYCGFCLSRILLYFHISVCVSQA